MRRRSACRQLLIGTSIRRYLPPIGTAGFERCCVSGKSRAPWPPPRMSARVSRITRKCSASRGRGDDRVASTSPPRGAGCHSPGRIVVLRGALDATAGAAASRRHRLRPQRGGVPRRRACTRCWRRPGLPDEIVVVDNASTDATAAVAAAVPGVRVVTEPRKGLVGRASAAGCRPARTCCCSSTPTAARRSTGSSGWSAASLAPPAPAGAVGRLPLLRLALVRADADPRLRLHGRAGDTPAGQAPAERRGGLLRRQLRGAGQRARRDWRVRHGHRVPRRGHQPRPPAARRRSGRAARRVLRAHLGAPLPRDGHRRGDRLYVRNFWSEILRHRPSDTAHLDVRRGGRRAKGFCPKFAWPSFGGTPP